MCLFRIDPLFVLIMDVFINGGLITESKQNRFRKMWIEELDFNDNQKLSLHFDIMSRQTWNNIGNHMDKISSDFTQLNNLCPRNKLI